MTKQKTIMKTARAASGPSAPCEASGAEGETMDDAHGRYTFAFTED